MRGPADSLLVRSLAVTYQSGHCVDPHRHPWAQLIFARCGVMEVVSDDHLWTVPPTRAIWIPAGVTHGIVMRGEVALRTLYLAPNLASGIDRKLGVVEIVPLLSEMIMHIAATGMLDAIVPSHERLSLLLVDLVGEARGMDLMLPLPRDPRARRVADHLLARPADPGGLTQLATMAGASLRTLERTFASELGMTIGTWRQKARLVHASAALAAGSSVTNAAIDCGYESTSAFIAAFRKQFGITPGRSQPR